MQNSLSVVANNLYYSFIWKISYQLWITFVMLENDFFFACDHSAICMNPSSLEKLPLFVNYL